MLPQRPFRPFKVPKKMWCYWDQSTDLDSLPPYPKAVVTAWKLLNPGWNFTVITAGNLAQFVPAEEVRATFPLCACATRLPVCAFRREISLICVTVTPP